MLIHVQINSLCKTSYLFNENGQHFIIYSAVDQGKQVYTAYMLELRYIPIYVHLAVINTLLHLKGIQMINKTVQILQNHNQVYKIKTGRTTKNQHRSP